MWSFIRVKDMDKELQRIAIAKSMGYTLEQIKGSDESEMRAYFQDREKPSNCIPNYLNDLNSMHEVEKHYSKKMNYVFHLRRVCGMAEYPTEEELSFWSEMCVFATAAQRAEAYLKTLNLWTE